MNPPAGWQNPISALPGQVQQGVDPALLLPARSDLGKTRLEIQRGLLLSGSPRFTSVQVTPSAVIWDGHHAVRAAAEENRRVDVVIVDEQISPSGPLILDLPVR